MALNTQSARAGPATVPLSLVVAVTASRAIGKNGGLPWTRLPTDMRFFRDVTTLGMNADPSSGKQNAVIMGRKTWESIPAKFQPLPGRVNVVLTRDVERIRSTLPAGVLAASTLDSAIDLLVTRTGHPGINHVFVVGGGQVYAEALAHPSCSRVFLTQIKEEIEGCDTWFPDYVETLGFAKAGRSELEAAAAPVTVPAGTVAEAGLSYEFVLYRKSSS